MSVAADWELAPAGWMAQLKGMRDRADEGAGNSLVRVYASVRPATVNDAISGTPQAEIYLAKPSGVFSGNAFMLQARDAGGALVLQSGLPRWADWVAADGTILLRANVSDMANDGGWKVEGSATPEGETSPRLYSGGIVLLGTAVLT